MYIRVHFINVSHLNFVIKQLASRRILTDVDMHKINRKGSMSF